MKVITMGVISVGLVIGSVLLTQNHIEKKEIKKEKSGGFHQFEDCGDLHKHHGHNHKELGDGHNHKENEHYIGDGHNHKELEEGHFVGDGHDHKENEHKH